MSAIYAILAVESPTPCRNQETMWTTTLRVGRVQNDGLDIGYSPLRTIQERLLAETSWTYFHEATADIL